jgi:hypothetical protein
MAGFNLKDLRDMIPEYDGDQSTLFDFIEAVNFAIENVPENQQNAIIFIIKSKLVGKARKFISSRQLREWNDIKDLLISHYGDCRDTEGLLYDLTSTFQKSNETPRAFAQRIENLLTKIRSSVALNNELNQAARNALNSSHEKIALKAFLAGLSDPLGSIIRCQKPNTLEQAEQFLIEEENITYLKNFKSSKPSLHDQVNNKIVPKENYPRHSYHKILNFENSLENSKLVYIISKDNNKFLIDSGAAISIMKPCIVPQNIKKHKEDFKIQGILNKHIKINESFYKKFNDSDTLFKIYIADLDIEFDAILGLDFLTTFDCIIDLKQNLLKTNFKDIPLHYQYKGEDEVELPPCTVQTINIKTNSHLNENFCPELNRDSQEKNPNSIVTNNNEKLDTTIANISPVEKELIIPVVNFDPVEITSKTAENVCNNLDIFLRHDTTSKQIHSDSGLEFNNQHYQKSPNDDGYKFTYEFSSTAQPQSNGSIERFYSTLSESLRSYHDDHSKENVLKGLNVVITSNNNNRSQSTKFTPQELNFGHIRSENEIITSQETQNQFVRDKNNLISYQYPEIAANQQNNKEKSKIRFDAHVKANNPNNYSFNQQDYVRQSEKGNKMKNKYNGPYKIIRSTNHNEILLETPERSKRGILNSLGSIWKTLTGNLDSSDGEYYDQRIDKLEKDDREIKNLIKEHIQVTTSTIKNFNFTIQKLQIDEQIFNDDFKIIEDEINKIEDNNYYFNNQLKLINTCEQLLESLVLIESQVNNIIKSITFAKLKVLHPSIIKPEYLLNQLSQISQHLDHNLPLHPSVYALPVLTNLVTLQAYQTNKRIVFILRIPLIEKEKYTLYHLYSIPTKDSKTNLFHTIIPESKYVALSENNRQYLKINSIEKCKDLQEETLLCSDLIPFPYENPPCEIEVLTKLTANEKCHPVLLDIEDYNVQKLKANKWIIITGKNLPITHTCSSGGPKAEIINQNSILTMAPRCTAFIGSIQVHAQEEKLSNYSEADVIPSIYYDCCENFTPPLNQRHQLKPLKINTLNLDDLKTAEFKLNQYKDQLDNLGKESFAHRHLSTFAIITIIVVVAIIVYVICSKCRLFKGLVGYFKGSHSDDGPPRPGSCCPQIFNYCNIRSNISRRPSIRIETDDHSEEVAYQRDIPLASLSTKRRL